jgi:hypothetical protein
MGLVSPAGGPTVVSARIPLLLLRGEFGVVPPAGHPAGPPGAAGGERLAGSQPADAAYEREERE